MLTILLLSHMKAFKDPFSTARLFPELIKCLHCQIIIPTSLLIIIILLYSYLHNIQKHLLKRYFAKIDILLVNASSRHTFTKKKNRITNQNTPKRSNLNQNFEFLRGGGG